MTSPSVIHQRLGPFHLAQRLENGAKRANRVVDALANLPCDIRCLAPHLELALRGGAAPQSAAEAKEDERLGARVAVMRDGQRLVDADVERSTRAVRDADRAHERLPNLLVVRREAGRLAVLRDADHGDLVAGPQLFEELVGGASRGAPFAERDAVAIHADDDQPSTRARRVGAEGAVRRFRFRGARPAHLAPKGHEVRRHDLSRLPVDGDGEFGAVEVGDRVSPIVDDVHVDFDHFDAAAKDRLLRRHGEGQGDQRDGQR